MAEQYKTQIEDFRNLKPYYDLVFENMTSLSTFSFARNYQKLTDALRELVTNAPSYIEIEWEIKDKKELLSAEDILDLIEDEYSKLFDRKFIGDPKHLTTDDLNELENLRDNYLKFSRKLRIKINGSFAKTGFLPKMDKSRIKSQSEKTRGASI